LEPPPRIAEIQHVVPQLLVVGPDVERHRQAGFRIDARSGGVDRQLSDRDTHAVGAQVAEAEDSLSVGDDDDADVLLRPVAQDPADLSAIRRGDEEALGVSRDVRELPAGLANRRRVDERQDPLDVFDHGLIEEPLVSLLQRRELHVSIDVPGQPIEVRHHPLHHLTRRRHLVRQQPPEAETLPVAPPEGDGSVERLVTENVGAALLHGVLIAWTMAGAAGGRLRTCRSG
jgi:hypothetical protein